MDRIKLSGLSLFCIIFSCFGQGKGIDVLKKMHVTHKGGICKSYSFSQRNTHYRNDTVLGNSEWHESVEFPDKFRIVFGEKFKGNYVIFRNDSVYNYRRSELVRSSTDSNTLLLLLGGMYYRDVEDVARRLQAKGYDLEVSSPQRWNGSSVYVIGALPGQDLKNQIWVDHHTLKIVRIIEKMNANDWMDMRFDSHQKLCNGWVENKVSFYRNGKLEQVEEYYDIKENVPFDSK